MLGWAKPHWVSIGLQFNFRDTDMICLHFVHFFNTILLHIIFNCYFKVVFQSLFHIGLIVFCYQTGWITSPHFWHFQLKLQFKKWVLQNLRPSVRNMFFQNCSTWLGCSPGDKGKSRGFQRVQVGLIRVRLGKLWSSEIKGGQVG